MSDAQTQAVSSEVIEECDQFRSIEKTALSIGFMPLTDCAPLVIAKELGYFSAQGLDVTLIKQFSWATIRDKLHAGVIDAAQLLSPMPIASTLGLNCPKHHVIAPMVLSQNGNAITIAESLYNELSQLNGSREISLPLSASLLKPVIEQRKAKGEKLTFATVYPHSCHYYQLCTWFERSNIALNDIEIVIIPPANMVEALQTNDIDGFCVGGPWNAKAVRDGVGVTCVTSCDIWPDVPEKVLGMRADWQKSHPNTTLALIRALKQSCLWLGQVANRFEAARLLSQHQYLNTPLSVVAPSLIGSCLVHHALSPRHIPSYNQFSNDSGPTMNKPDIFHGEWLVNHMTKHQHVKGSEVDYDLLYAIFRPDLYLQAMKELRHHRTSHKVQLTHQS